MTDTTEPNKLPLTSLDIAAEKRQELRRVLAATFPEIIAENKIDLDQLKRVLGDWVEPDRERFGLNWPGKAACMKVIQAPSVGTLKPCPEESVEWDTTQNVFIEGDNLEVLKLLQKSYFGKIKMIYIDPPYNTGSDFIYPDNYAETLETYLEYTGQKDSEGRKFATNTDSSGRFHSRWLNMIYPRLYLAKNLLTEDGYIIVSIDDAEQSNLKQAMDIIFGQENYLSTLVWDKNRKNDAKYFSVGHEYMLVYARNESYLKSKNTILRQPKHGVEEIRELFAKLKGEHGADWQKIREGLRQFFASLEADDPKRPLGRYTKVDENGPYRDDGDLNWPGGGGPTYEVIHPTTGRPCRKPPSGWRYPTPERFWEEVAKGRVVFGEDETTTPRIRRNLFDSDEQVMGSVAFSYAQTATNDFTEIFDGKRVFDNPKNFKDIASLVEYITNDGDIILDFFAGSASTAHAVIHTNLVQDAHRRYIMVQLPEPVDPQSEAASLGLRHIFDVGTDRMRRVRAKIKTHMSKYDGDLGFRVFKLGASAFQEWNGQADGVSDGDLLGRIDRHASHLSEIASATDVLFELLLKDGFPIITAVNQQQVAGKTLFSIAGGALLVCLDKELTQEVIDAMADMEPSRVICLDAGFQGNDQLKANAVQTFKARARNRETTIEFRTV